MLNYSLRGMPQKCLSQVFTVLVHISRDHEVIKFGMLTTPSIWLRPCKIFTEKYCHFQMRLASPKEGASVCQSIRHTFVKTVKNGKNCPK